MSTVAALCAGYGGLELALTCAEIDHEVAWYAEIDPHAAAVMAAHHPTAPNLGDLTTITAAPPADVVTAGFPCQPVSTAGRREGVNDERWIVDDVCRVARFAGARTLVLENVAGILTANGGDALARVCEAMAREGFSRWEWCTLRACDVGAPHRRKRWFCVAHADEAGRQGRQPARRRDVPSRGAAAHADRVVQQRDRQPGEGRRSDFAGCTPPSDPGRVDPERWRGPSPVAGPARLPRLPNRSGTDSSWDAAGDRSPAAPDPDGDRLQEFGLGWLLDRIRATPGDDADRRHRERFGGYAEAVTRWERATGRPAPEPTIDGRLSHLFVEWMMGLPAGWVTDHLNRRPALRVLGNGVVPQQAAAAIAFLEAA